VSMQRTVRYRKELRQKAKAEKVRLYTLEMDGRAIDAGYLTLQGIATGEVQQVIEEAFQKIAWIRQGKSLATFAPVAS
jgi:hypothetical protein